MPHENTDSLQKCHQSCAVVSLSVNVRIQQRETKCLSEHDKLRGAGAGAGAGEHLCCDEITLGNCFQFTQNLINEAF